MEQQASKARAMQLSMHLLRGSLQRQLVVPRLGLYQALEVSMTISRWEADRGIGLCRHRMSVSHFFRKCIGSHR